MAELEAEMAGWQQRAVFALSFHRWVPAEAFIREFRHTGVLGIIVPISLAFCCHIFRFEDPVACDLVLNRPWVVNGQAIGTEAWRPEFIPVEDSISSALLWVRMPNRPMEFWNEDILRVILEPTGQFICADVATLAKNRGGFARVCACVDLCRPHRPGTRVQGIHGPFWQQFAYENMEGICPRCGTLHLEGPCSLSAMADAKVSSSGSVYGPWIAVVHQWRVASGS